METDTKEIEVANLAVKPVEDFKKLTDKLAEFATPETHPLDDTAVQPPEPEEPVVPPKPEVPTPEPQPSVPVAQTPSHPQSLLDAARAVGIEEQYLEPGVVQTQALLDFVVKMRLAAVPQPAKAVVPESDDADFEYLEKEVGMDKRAIAIMRKMKEGLAKLETRPDPEQVFQRAIAQQSQQQQTDRALDAAFNSLGPKFEKLVGKGTLSEVDDNAKQKRVFIYTAAGVKGGDSAAVIAKKITEAANRAYGGILPEVAPPAPAANGRITQEQWDAGAVAKPTAAKAKPSKGEEAAAKHIQAMMREMGVTNKGVEDELDGVPNW